MELSAKSSYGANSTVYVLSGASNIYIFLPNWQSKSGFQMAVLLSPGKTL